MMAGVPNIPSFTCSRSLGSVGFPLDETMLKISGWRSWGEVDDGGDNRRLKRMGTSRGGMPFQRARCDQLGRSTVSTSQSRASRRCRRWDDQIGDGATVARCRQAIPNTRRETGACGSRAEHQRPSEQRQVMLHRRLGYVPTCWSEWSSRAAKSPRVRRRSSWLRSAVQCRW